MTIEDHISDLDSRIQKLLDRWEIASTEGKLEKILEIRRWLTNFKASELEDMFPLLEKLEVISGYEIQTLLKSLEEKLVRGRLMTRRPLQSQSDALISIYITS